MRRRRQNAGPGAGGEPKVCGFRLDEAADRRLRELAGRFDTSPSRYAKGVLLAHLLVDGAAPAGVPPAADLDALGAFVRQVRDEFLREAEQQGKRLEALAARVNALVAHAKALTERVAEVDRRLADFLGRVEPM